MIQSVSFFEIIELYHTLHRKQRIRIDALIKRNEATILIILCSCDDYTR